MPPAIRRKLGDELRDPSRQVRLELNIRHAEVIQQLLGQRLDVVLVDQRVHELKRRSSNGDVAVLDALDDGVPVPLHSLRVHRDHLGERVQRDVSNVVVLVTEETAEDVHRQHAKPAHGFYAYDRCTQTKQDVSHIARTILKRNSPFTAS